MPRRNARKSPLLFFATLAALGLGALFAYRYEVLDAYRSWRRGPIPVAETRQEYLAAATAATNTNVSTTPPSALHIDAPIPARSAPAAPKGVNLKVPFILQAPFQNWDAVHEDACEEASTAMIKGFLNGDTIYTKDRMEQLIMEIVGYENRTLGYNKDTDADTTSSVASWYFGTDKTAKSYGFGAIAETITSMADVKRVLDRGFPVIVPAYGKALKNPNFKNGGPLYHMLVIKGYDGARIITNDPGTRNGENYVYDEKLLWNAIHDWNGGDVPNGRKVMIRVTHDDVGP